MRSTSQAGLWLQALVTCSHKLTKAGWRCYISVLSLWFVTFITIPTACELLNCIWNNTVYFWLLPWTLGTNSPVLKLHSTLKFLCEFNLTNSLLSDTLLEGSPDFRDKHRSVSSNLQVLKRSLFPHPLVSVFAVDSGNAYNFKTRNKSAIFLVLIAPLPPWLSPVSDMFNWQAEAKCTWLDSRRIAVVSPLCPPFNKSEW